MILLISRYEKPEISFQYAKGAMGHINTLGGGGGGGGGGCEI